MRGVSAAGRRAVLEALEETLGGRVDASGLGDELFAAAGLLDSSPVLRRSLTDPSTDQAARAGLARAVLGDRVRAATTDLVATAAEQRWSASRDLADTLEEAGVTAHVAAAESDGRLEDVEDELFRFGRLVQGTPQLRDALTDRSMPTDGKQQLVAELLARRTTPATQALAVQAVSGRHRSIGVALEEYQRVAARRRERLVATVTTATELATRERNRLAEALAATYDRQVHLNLVVEPDVLGGVRVEIGDEVVDGTVVSRLHEARRRIAG